MEIHSLVLARPPVSSLDGCELRESYYGVDARLAELVAERRNRTRRAQNHEGQPIPTKGIDTNEPNEILLHPDRNGTVDTVNSQHALGNTVGHTVRILGRQGMRQEATRHTLRKSSPYLDELARCF